MCIRDRLSAFLLFTGCVTNDFDLSEGINTEITIGGDSLSAPIGSTKPILLGDLIDSLDVDILKKSADGTYAIHMNDSLSAVSYTHLDVYKRQVPICTIMVFGIEY